MSIINNMNSPLLRCKLGPRSLANQEERNDYDLLKLISTDDRHAINLSFLLFIILLCRGCCHFGGSEGPVLSHKTKTIPFVASSAATKAFSPAPFSAFVRCANRVH